MKFAAGLFLALWIPLGFSAVYAGSPESFAVFADSLLAQPALAGSSWSVQVYSLSRDAVVFDHDGNRLLTPASVTKLLTSAAALDAMGGDYRFSTEFAYRGGIDANGSLIGDLVVLAGGDPTFEIKADKSLRVPIMRTWADSLRARGIRSINGNIVLRTWPYRHESAPDSWEAGDINAGFAPPADGFGFNSNVCHLQVLPANEIGDSARFVIEPAYAPVRLKPRVRTTPAQTECWLDLQVAPADTTAVISGDMPLNEDGEFLWVSVQDPVRYFGLALKDALERRDFSVSGGIVVDRTVPNSHALIPIFVHRSAPLSEIVSTMNKESDNFISEQVLRALGLAAGGAPDRHSGLNAVMRFVQQYGLDKREVHLEDGSGLSRHNLISARAVNELLRCVFLSGNRDLFQSTLSISGTDGTLAYRLSSPGVIGRVLGKTGTMTQVSNTAGYLNSASGEIFAFAFLCNHYTNSVHHVRATQDRLLERLAAE